MNLLELWQQEQLQNRDDQSDSQVDDRQDGSDQYANQYGDGYEGGYDDGGLPPGGAPEQQPCDCGPCPDCAEDRQMSSPCSLQLGHGGDHQCAYGDAWEQAGPSAAPQRKYCGAPCPTQPCGWTCTKKFMHYPPEHMCRLGHTW